MAEALRTGGALTAELVGSPIAAHRPHSTLAEVANCGRVLGERGQGTASTTRRLSL
jgi:hypothetical protein